MQKLKIIVTKDQKINLRGWQKLGKNDKDYIYYCRAVQLDKEAFLQILIYDKDKKLVACPSYYPASLLNKGKRFLNGLQISMDKPELDMTPEQTIKMLKYTNSIFHLEKDDKDKNND